MKAKKLSRIVLATAIILLIPLIWMQFSDDVKWTALDFIVAGALLFITGLIYEFVVAQLKDRRRRLIAGLALLAILLLLWVHLAVGIVDSWPLAGS